MVPEVLEFMTRLAAFGLLLFAVAGFLVLGLLATWTPESPWFDRGSILIDWMIRAGLACMVPLVFTLVAVTGWWLIYGDS